MTLMIDSFEPEILIRDWGEEIIVAATDRYLGKVLKMRAGTRGGLQYHREKDETFHLWSGEALVRSDDGGGALVETLMEAGESYHIPPGAVHQVEALEDCIFFEASTPHYDDRVRVESDYAVPNGSGLPTTGHA